MSVQENRAPAELLAYLAQAIPSESLNGSGPLIVGFSGGPDSLYLLDGLAQLGLTPLAAHLDHGMRPTAAAEVGQVAAAAAACGCELTVAHADVPAYAAAERLSLEEAARAVRYRFLFATAEARGASAVLVGHTADDQVETVLMHLLRGAGLAGLKGMEAVLRPSPWSATIPLVRPLLGIWRAEISAALAARGLHPLEDGSNRDLRFFRNRLRHELIPALEALQPAARRAIWRSATILQADEAALSGQTDTAWEQTQRAAGPGWLAFDAAAWNAQPLALRRRLLRRAAALLRPDLRDFDFAAAGRALDLAAGEADAIVTLPGELDWRRQGARLILARAAAIAGLDPSAWPQLTAAPLRLDVPGALDLGAGWTLTAAAVPLDAAQRATALANADPFVAYLDAAAVTEPLGVRPRRPGERLQPLGMNGHQVKLSDYWIDHKLPRPARAAWPIVVCGATIAWLPGFTLTHSFRLRPTSQEALRLELRQTA